MKLALAALGTSLALGGCAAGPWAARHGAHHPPATAANAQVPAPGEVATMMKSMQDMHDKLLATTTPEERARLMQEHMKLMQDGTSMMGRMRGKGGMGGGIPMCPEMMGQRVDMMEMMMQMMVDREAMKPPATQ